MEIVIRSAVVFFFILVVTRAMGKKELSELSAFELILLITIGDLVQQAVTQEDMSLTGAMLAVGTIALLIVGLSYLGFRWASGRPIIEGIPIVVVKDGEPVWEAMKIERLRMDDLVEGARLQGIGDLRRIRLGILEPDGRFSFIRYEGESQQEAPERKAT